MRVVRIVESERETTGYELFALHELKRRSVWGDVMKSRGEIEITLLCELCELFCLIARSRLHSRSSSDMGAN